MAYIETNNTIDREDNSHLNQGEEQGWTLWSVHYDSAANAMKTWSYGMLRILA